MNRTSIEWTKRLGPTDGFTWNPIRAQLRHDSEARERLGPRVGTFCTRISPGCQHCYASVMNKRFGTGLEYTVPNLAEHEFFLDEKILEAPLRRRKPSTIFVGDMFDLFHESIPEEFITRVWELMDKAPQHVFQVLTKRAVRLCEYMTEFFGRNPLPNVWLGVSVEDQPRADERVPLILQTPAAVRFLSVEPMLEPVMLPHAVFLPTGICGDFPFGHTTRRGGGNAVAFSNPYGALSVLAEDGKLLGIKPGEFTDKGLGVDWVICGGESGPGSRPFHYAWAQSLLEQCKAAGVPFFMKQAGRRPVSRLEAIGSGKLVESCRSVESHSLKGSDPAEWPEQLRVRQWPEVAV